MRENVMAIAEPQSVSLRGLVRTVTNDLTAERLPIADMSRATSLELDRTLSLDPKRAQPQTGDIQRLEGPIQAIDVSRHSGDSPIRYFLDGTQRTLPVWRVGTTPIIAAVTAAAILQRPSPAEISIIPESLVARINWILPRYTDDPTLNHIVHLLESMGNHVFDPLEAQHRDDPDVYQRMVGDYTDVLQRSYSTATTLRARIESDLLQFWRLSISPTDHDSWIVVDGLLLTDTPNAIGLVKSAHAQHFQGQEAAVLYDLPIGHRTGAYKLASSDVREGAERAMWYLRMDNATGQDARHGLIRLESSEVLADPGLIDPISSWILAERAPRPSTDARWPTLLYPIHLLERMLKRRLDALTAGWPT